MKRALIRVLGDIHDRPRSPCCFAILARIATHTKTGFLILGVFPRWIYAEHVAHRPPDHLLFVIRTHFAYIDDSADTGCNVWICGSSQCIAPECHRLATSPRPEQRGGT